MFQTVQQEINDGLKESPDLVQGKGRLQSFLPKGRGVGFAVLLFTVVGIVAKCKMDSQQQNPSNDDPLFRG